MPGKAAKVWLSEKQFEILKRISHETTASVRLVQRRRNHFVSHEETLFHGILASSIPIPQVSVIPAKINPAPTKPDKPINQGCTS